MSLRNPGIYWFFFSGLFFHVTSHGKGTSSLAKHGQIDVGKIISVVILDNSDEAPDIEKLTADFRAELQQVRDRDVVNRFENSLNTLRKLLPELAPEERRRLLQRSRGGASLNPTRTIPHGLGPPGHAVQFKPRSGLDAAPKDNSLPQSALHEDSEGGKEQKEGNASPINGLAVMPAKRPGSNKPGLPCAPPYKPIPGETRPEPVFAKARIDPENELPSRPDIYNPEGVSCSDGAAGATLEEPEEDLERSNEESTSERAKEFIRHRYPYGKQHEAHKGPMGDDCKPVTWGPAELPDCEEIHNPLEESRRLVAAKVGRTQPSSNEKSTSQADAKGDEPMAQMYPRQKALENVNNIRLFEALDVPLYNREEYDLDHVKHADDQQKGNLKKAGGLEKRAIYEENVEDFLDDDLFEGKPSLANTFIRTTSKRDKLFGGLTTRLVDGSGLSTDATGPEEKSPESEKRGAESEVADMRKVLEDLSRGRNTVLIQGTMFPKKKNGTTGLDSTGKSLTVIYNLKNGEKKKASPHHHHHHRNHETKIRLIRLNGVEPSTNQSRGGFCDCSFERKHKFRFHNIRDHADDLLRSKSANFDGEKVKPSESYFGSPGEAVKDSGNAKTDFGNTTSSILAEDKQFRDKTLSTKLTNDTSEIKEEESNVSKFLKKVVRVNELKISDQVSASPPNLKEVSLASGSQSSSTNSTMKSTKAPSSSIGSKQIRTEEEESDATDPEKKTIEASERLEPSSESSTDAEGTSEEGFRRSYASQLGPRKFPKSKKFLRPSSKDLRFFVDGSRNEKNAVRENWRFASKPSHPPNEGSPVVVDGANVERIVTDEELEYMMKSLPYIAKKGKSSKSIDPPPYNDLKENVVRSVPQDADHKNQEDQTIADREASSLDPEHGSSSLMPPAIEHTTRVQTNMKSFFYNDATNAGKSHESSRHPMIFSLILEKFQGKGSTPFIEEQTTAIPPPIGENRTSLLKHSNRTDVIREKISPERKAGDWNKTKSEQSSSLAEEDTKGSSTDSAQSNETAIPKKTNPLLLPADLRELMTNLRRNMFPSPLSEKELDEMIMTSSGDSEEDIDIVRSTAAKQNTEDMNGALRILGGRICVSPFRKVLEDDIGSLSVPEEEGSNVSAVVNASTSKNSTGQPDAVTDLTLELGRSDNGMHLKVLGASLAEGSKLKREAGDEDYEERKQQHGFQLEKTLGADERGPSEDKNDSNEEQMWNFGQRENLTRMLGEEAIDFIPDETEDRLIDPATASSKLIASN